MMGLPFGKLGTENHHILMENAVGTQHLFMGLRPGEHVPGWVDLTNMTAALVKRSISGGLAPAQLVANFLLGRVVQINGFGGVF